MANENEIVVGNLGAILTASNLAVNWKVRSAYQLEPLVLGNYFPDQKTPGMVATDLKGWQEVPGVLQPAAFDAKPIVGSFQLNLEKVEVPMFFFREAFHIPETLRQRIGDFLARSVAYAKPLLQEAIQKNVNFVDKGLTSVELMRAGAITEGRFAITTPDENGRPIVNEFNYDPKNIWHTNGINYVTLSGTSRWISENANENDFDPIVQIKKQMDAVHTATGATITEVLMNSVTFLAMCQSVKMLKYMNPVGYANTLTLDSDIQLFIEKKLKIRFVFVDRVYQTNKKTLEKFFPDGYAVLVPGEVGRTCWGTTPEEYDLMGDPTIGTSAASGVDVAVVNSGITISTSVPTTPPIIPQTTVSEMVAPTFKNMDQVCSMKVF